MLDALRKSKLVTEEQVAVVEKERREKENPKPIDSAPKVALAEVSVTKKKLNALLNGEKSQKFLSHLMWAYVPYTKAQRIFDPESQSCCLCNIGIISVGEVMNISGTSLMSDLQERFKLELQMVDDNEPEEKANEKLRELLQQQHLKNFGNRRLGVMSNGSSRVMCQACFTEFYDWISLGILNGDRFINRVLRNIREKDSAHKEE